MGNQSRLTGGGDTVDPDTVLAGQTLHELLGQEGDVFAAFAQRGHRDGDHIEAEIEILAELLPGDALFEVAVGGGDHPHVDPDEPIAAHALEFTLLQHAQELGLDMGRHLADLIEQNGTPVSQLETPLALGQRAGESALFVAEELALDEILRDGRAVDLDERPVGPGALAIDGPRHQLLAGAAFTLDEHRGLGSGDFTDEVAKALHGRTAPQQFGTGRLGRIALAEVPVDLDELGELLGLLEGDVDLVGRERLDEVVEGPVPHAGHGRFDRRMPRHHDHQRFDRPVLQDPQDVGAFSVGKTDIHEHQIPVVFAQVILGDGEGRNPDHVEAAALELDLQRPADHLVVFDDQDLLERHVLAALGDNDLSGTHAVRLDGQPCDA